MTSAPTFERTSQDSRTLGSPSGDLLLRVVGGEHHGRTVRLQAAKCTIGSAPGCTLRLRAPGIEPLHCLILRGPNGTLVRRVGEEAEINGRKFEDSPLKTGDRLKVGPITFVVAGSEKEESPRPHKRIVSASQQRDLDRQATREARALGHQRVRKAVAALRRNRDSVRELAYSADRRKLELDRLVLQLTQVQRDLTSERERHLHDLDQQRTLGLQVSQLSHSLERLRQEALASQTKHQAETDHWRLERSRLTEDLAKREQQLNQLQAELQRRQWDLDQAQSQNDRLQRQMDLEHEQVTAARARFQQELTANQLERTRAQEDLVSKDRQLAQTQVELQLRQREADKLREQVERLQKQVLEEQQQLKAELERRDATNATEERDRLAADVVARDRQIGDLQAQLVLQQGTVTQLREELARQREELQTFRAENVQATQSWEIERLQIIGQVSEAVAHDATVLSERQKVVDDLEARLRTVENDLHNREREIEAQRVELNQLRDDRDRRLSETLDWQERLQSKEAEVVELRKTNAELSIRLSSSEDNEPIEQTLIVPALAGTNPRLSKEQTQSLERQRDELAERERRLADQEAILAERQQALRAAENELQVERTAVLHQKSSLETEQSRLAQAARNLVEQEQAFVLSQEELSEKEQQLLELQQRLESHVSAVEGGRMSEPAPLAPSPSLPDASAGEADSAPFQEFERPIGIEAVDFSEAQAELEKLGGELFQGNSFNPEQNPGKSAYEAEDEIMLPTAESPLEGVDRRFRRANEVAVELPPAPIENHAALADAVLADDIKPAPDVTPDSLPQWSYEHEAPQRMDTIVGLRMRNLLQDISDNVGESSVASNSLSQAMDGNAPQPTSESSVDDILSRLREAGILKAKDNPVAESPAANSLAPPARKPEPESFSQRYEERQPEPTPEPEPVGYTPQSAPASAESSGGESDDSIEAYMQQLMRRVRGDQTPSVSTSGPNPMYKAAAAPLANAEPVPAAIAGAIPQPQKPVTPEEYIPRSQAPEVSASMAAMRELANTQARSAIHVHQKKLGKQQSGAKTIVAICAIGFGGFAGYLGMQNGSWSAIAAALLSASLGGYWLLQALWLAGRSLANLPKKLVLERPQPIDKQSRKS